VRRPTTTSSDQILINRLGTMAEPFPGLCLVAVRGFSVMVAGAMLAVYALLAVRQPAEPDEGLLCVLLTLRLPAFSASMDG
jgi:hypothetical protein